MSVQILLEDRIEKLFEENPELNQIDKNKFEIAVASFSNVKHLNGIDFDDLIDGILGAGGDEGIDHCYVFCNGNLVVDENENINKDSSIKVKFFQTKKTNGFQTDGFRKLKEGIEQIFHIELDTATLALMGANSDFIEKTELIRALYRKAMRERAKFSCEVFYVTNSSKIEISQKILKLENDLKGNSLNIPFEFHYWGTQELLDMTEKFDERIELKFISQPLEIKERNVSISGFAGFMNGSVLVKSLIDDKTHEFKSHLTEGNVRFFLGEDKTINSSIIETARNPDKAENFWAMNNGLTILGDSIETLGNAEYSISNPQIVNGCQTIHCLYHVFNEQNGTLPDPLKVFVKLVNTSNLDVQTDIISATNSQNPVKSASLKANDDIQRNIEKHLKQAGIYYERRENYYKRQGYTGNKVIGLIKMAQIIHAVVNKESITAVNDTSTLFENETKYNSIFNNSADFDIYKFAAVLYQKIWSLKNSDMRLNSYDNEEKSLISKGGFVFLHIMSTLILSFATIEKDALDIHGVKIIDNINIGFPPNKNNFSNNKEWIFQVIANDVFLEEIYAYSRVIFFKAAEEYSSKTLKLKQTLFKNRGFDKEYLRHTIKSWWQVNSETVLTARKKY